MSSQLSHVTEVRSKIYGKTISFLMMLNGKSVNTGKFKIRDLHGPGKIVNVDVHEATDWILSIHNLKVGVVVDGELKMSLAPIHFITHARITFDSRLHAGKTIFFATGLNTMKDDKYLRMRCRKQKRQEVYETREKQRELVTFLGQCVLEENELSQERVVAAPVAGLPSHGRTNHNNATLSLAYEEPSVVTGTGEVAVIPATAINKKMADMMKYALVGFLCLNEIPKCSSSFLDFLTERLAEFRECKVLLHGNGFFTFVFSSEEYRTKVLEHGQLLINGKPLILKKWTQDLTHEPSLFLHSLPVWVRIYNLNLAYWSMETFAIISREIGSLLFFDKATTSIIKEPESIFNCASTSMHCIYYAKVCIEVNPFDVLPNDASVSIIGKPISVRFEYDWKPQLCTHCCSLYHHTSSSNTARGDAFSQRQKQHVIIMDNETPEQIQGNTRPPSHSGLITEDDR